MDCYYFYIYTSSFKLFLICLFESVVVVAFESAFHSEIHQNNIFLFLQNYF
jgi:hypothetical protein